MNKNFEMEVQLVNEVREPLELRGVSLDAEMYLNGRIRYRFEVGVTDSRGKLRFTFQDLEQSRLSNQEFALMDYNTPLEECDANLGLIVPSMAEIEQRQLAIDKWFSHVDDQPMRQKVEAIRTRNNRKVVCEKHYVNVDCEPRAQVKLACRNNEREV